MNDTVLVTGATGFVGSAVARRLLDAGYTVRTLVRESSRLDNLRGLDVELFVGDLRIPDSLARAMKGCDGLFHVAADYRLWARSPHEIYASNLRGSRNIILAAIRAGVGRIVYTSSVATLGLPADGSQGDEETPVSASDMIGHYKRSKFLAEQKVRKLAEKEGLDVVTVNPSAPVGPRDIKPTPTGRLILDAARGRMPAYVDTGLNIVHVDDVATGHLQAYEHGTRGRRYVLGGEDMTLQQIILEAAAVAGRKPRLVRMPHNVVMPFAYLSEGVAQLTGRAPALTVAGAKLAKKKMFFSHARAERELGYQPRPAKAAFVDAVEWFRSNGYF
ncbi:MAG TPA: hopanoid-associated sugar epimerase [Gammaproteobacteria bacterium]|nr:hopanoid-associated sugar epimerase [Gammaproteobacteria bacterium]